MRNVANEVSGNVSFVRGCRREKIGGGEDRGENATNAPISLSHFNVTFLDDVKLAGAVK
jgi:hypothetical protein